MDLVNPWSFLHLNFEASQFMISSKPEVRKEYKTLIRKLYS